MPRQLAEKCPKGHSDWIFNKGKRRCRTCHNSYSRKQKPLPPPAWGVAGNGKAYRAGRGGSFEDTWSRTELMKIRGYGE